MNEVGVQRFDTVMDQQQKRKISTDQPKSKLIGSRIGPESLADSSKGDSVMYVSNGNGGLAGVRTSRNVDDLKSKAWS